MSEFVVRPGSDAIERKARKADQECERRIISAYPIQRQIFLALSLLYDLAGYSGDDQIRGVSSIDYIISRDKSDVKKFMRFVNSHRAAADALKTHIARNSDEIPRIDVTAEKWWPQARDYSDETR